MDAATINESEHKMKEVLVSTMQLSPTVKDLGVGVMLDHWVSFKHRVEYASENHRP